MQSYGYMRTSFESKLISIMMPYHDKIRSSSYKYKIQNASVRALETGRKTNTRRTFLACFDVIANKFYIYWQCTYIVFILQYQNVGKKTITNFSDNVSYRYATWSNCLFSYRITKRWSNQSNLTPQRKPCKINTYSPFNNLDLNLACVWTVYYTTNNPIS